MAALLPCVTVEDEVAILDGCVAEKAGLWDRFRGGFAVVELSEPPMVKALQDRDIRRQARS